VNPWGCPKKKQENRDYQDGWEAGQEKLVEWLKGQLWEYTGKTKDMRINKATWRALCESLGVAP
jgi:hypothetical protein